MSEKAEIKQPEVPELEKQRRIIDTGHNTAITEFLEWLQEMAGILGAHSMAVSDVRIERLWALMPEELVNGRKTVIRKFWKWISDKDKAIQKKSREEGGGVRDIRLFDINILPMMYEFFKIDPQEIERERRELLAGLRGSHALEKSRKDLGLN